MAETIVTIWIGIQNLFVRLKNRIITLNLFDTRSIDVQTIKVERWSTRIYLLLLFFALISFTLYTAIGEQTITIINKKPSLTKYLNLYNSSYSNTLTCPCSSISINHENFIQINYTLHPICSSEFILNQNFRESIFAMGFSNRSDYQMIWPMEVRKSLTPYLSLLTSLCRLSITTLDDAIHAFDIQSFITLEIISPDILHSQILSSLNHMKEQAPISLLNSLDISQSITAGNQIASGWATNYVYDLRREDYFSVSYSSLSDIHSWCDCLSAKKCPIPMGIYDYPTWDTHGYYNLSELKANKTILNLFSDCLPLDGALISSLYCLYDVSCIETLETIFNLSIPPPLHKSSLKSFRINDTIQTLLDRLFVDEWQNTSSYSGFYRICAPTHCSYSFLQYRSIFYVFNKILGIIGGLTVALRIIVPFIVKKFIKLLSKRNSDRTIVRCCSIILIRDFFYKNMADLWKALVELNLFDNGDTDDVRNIRSERISTRVYLLLLGLSLLILIFYTGFASQMKTLTINNPSLDEYERLYEKYRDTLTCPCSHISMNNGQFVNISFTLHPICLSNILSLNWNLAMSGVRSISKYGSGDFRDSVASYFSLIDKLCSFAKLAIDKALVSFYVGEFVNNHLIDRKSFEVQAISRVNKFVDTTTTDFFTSIQIFRMIDQGNQPQKTSMANARLILNTDTSVKTLFMYTSNINISCVCYIYNQCIDRQFLKRGTSIDRETMDILGLVIGCSQLESVLRSTLECWFDEACLTVVVAYILEITLEKANVTQLDASNMDYALQFSVNSTFETLLKSMLVNTWKNTSSYQSLYSACSPSSCTYSFAERNDILYTILTIFGLFGGLTTVFRFIVPITVTMVLKYIEKRRNIESATQPSHHGSISNRLYCVWKKIVSMIISLNLFKKHSSNIDTLPQERIITRVYILLLIGSISVFAIYSALEQQTYVVTIQSPTVDNFEYLQILDNTTLYCPCSSITIEYGKFLTVEASLHPICDSDFVTDYWIRLISLNILMYHINSDSGLPNEFQYRVLSIFESLFLFCQQARDTIDNAIIRFATNQFVTSEPFSRDEFKVQSRQLLLTLESSVSMAFMRTLQLIRETNQINGLLNIYLSNWYYPPYTNWNPISNYSDSPYSRKYGNCSCAVSSECVETAFFHFVNNEGINSTFFPTGFVMGCDALESLLRSSLDCLFNQQCIDSFCYALRTMRPDDWQNKCPLSVLDSSHSSFPINTTVETLLDRMMVDRWTNISSFESFYANCSPIYCTYLRTARPTLIYIITVVIGFYGGVSVSLRFLLPLCIKLCSKTIQRIQNYRHQQT